MKPTPTIHKTYDQMHQGLQWYFGPASQFPCLTGCGAPGKDWAFQYPADCEEVTDEKGRKYSLRFEDYGPMCRSCHRRFDMLQPERRAKQMEHLRTINERAKADPEYSAKMRAMGQRGLEVIRKNREAGIPIKNRDPEDLRRYGRMVGNLRRICSECGMETAAGPLARHQEKTGHEGWTAA